MLPGAEFSVQGGQGEVGGGDLIELLGVHTLSAFDVAVSATTNRITTSGYSYDAAGNLTVDGSLTYQWDGESRLKSLNSGSTGVYTYDGDGRRVMKQVGSR